MRKYRSQWESLGRSDPFWAVLTDPKKKTNRWDPDEFFASGQRDVATTLQRLSDFGVAVEKNVALDFGCGVGRISRALSPIFRRVVALDISLSMLESARELNKAYANIEFVHNDEAFLRPIASSSVDFIYTSMVLQHIPAKYQESFIADFGRVLKTGGVAVFQVPVGRDFRTLVGWADYLLPGFVKNSLRRLKYGPNGVMEIHCLPALRVASALNGGDLTLCKATSDKATGKGFHSQVYIVTKV